MQGAGTVQQKAPTSECQYLISCTILAMLLKALTAGTIS